MPKINFNVPLLDIEGGEIPQIQLDPKNVRPGPNGEMIAEPLRDESGAPIYKPMQLKNLITDLLLAPYDGDGSQPFSDRVKRGKLARKVATSSTANYRSEELLMIQELAAKSRSTLVLLNLEDLINGRDETEETIIGESNDRSAA